jgi:hypothetical protein
MRSEGIAYRSDHNIEATQMSLHLVAQPSRLCARDQ